MTPILNNKESNWKPLLSDSPIERALGMEINAVKQRVEDIYNTLTSKKTTKDVKKEPTSEDFKSALNIIAGFLPGGPKNNVLKKLLTQTKRVGVVKVPSKTKFRKIVEAMYGHELKPNELDDFMNESLGLETKGLKLINTEAIAEGVKVNPKDPSDILSALKKLGEDMKKTSAHERAHTATHPIVKFTQNIIRNQGKLDSEGAKLLPLIDDVSNSFANEKVASRAFGVENTILGRAVKKQGFIVAGNTYQTADEYINNAWMVYNSKGGRELLRGRKITKAASDYFDTLAMQPYFDPGKLVTKAAAQSSSKLNPMKIPAKGIQTVKESIKSELNMDDIIESNWYTRSGKKIVSPGTHVVKGRKILDSLGSESREWPLDTMLKRGWVREAIDIDTNYFEIMPTKSSFKTLKKIIHSRIIEGTHKDKLIIEVANKDTGYYKVIYTGNFDDFSKYYTITKQKYNTTIRGLK